jgi:hypothetical protein
MGAASTEPNAGSDNRYPPEDDPKSAGGCAPNATAQTGCSTARKPSSPMAASAL